MVDTIDVLRGLSHPVTGECLSDKQRIDAFVAAGTDAADELARLRTFYKQVAKAAGNLDGLPDGHAFDITWRMDDDDGATGAVDPFITAGMIRRAAL